MLFRSYDVWEEDRPKTISLMPGSDFSESLSFESGSSGWQGGIEVTGTKQFGGHRIVPFDGNKMGFLSPTGYGNNWNGARQSLQLSSSDIQEADGAFGGPITNVDFAFKDISLNANESFAIEWNFSANDYAPYNDGSFASLSPIKGTTGGGTLNGSVDSLIPLASIQGQGERVGNYGSSGWETLTVGSNTGGDYRLGFATFNLRDTAYAPSLAIDHVPEITETNNAPTANSVSYELTEDVESGLLNFDASDIDNDSLTYKLTTNPSNGSVVLNDNGKGFDYTPNANYNGPDSFKYVANDGSLDSEEAVVSLTINPVNDPVSIEKIVSGDTNLFVDNSSEITVSGDTILDKAFSPDLPDFYSYSLELEDIDQSDQIYLSKSGGDNFGQLDFDNLGSGDRFATFTYTPANSNPLSSVVTENYTISASDRQDNTGSSDSHLFKVNVIGSGLGNNLNINSSNSGSIFRLSGAFCVDSAIFRPKRPPGARFWAKTKFQKNLKTCLRRARFSFSDFLAKPTDVRDWNIQGLPQDSFSTENGVIVTRGRRWALMIDPQGQANRWVRNIEAKSGIECVKNKSDSGANRKFRLFRRAAVFGTIFFR